MRFENINLVYFMVILFIFFLSCALLVVVSLKHFILTLLFLDLLLLANVLLFMFVGFENGIGAKILGYNYALVVLGVAAADTAVGLGLGILYYKATGKVSLD
jgi:NADH-quinone oxidoreductase subunit K